MRHAGPRAFLDRAEPWLLKREAENNLILGVAESLSRGASGQSRRLYFATVEDDGAVAGCAFRTPPYKIGMTRMPTRGVLLLARDVGQVHAELPAALGPVREVRAFGDAWATLRGVVATPGPRQRIHSLEQVAFPAAPTPGSVRPACPEDIPLVADWLKDFIAVTGHIQTDVTALARRLTAPTGRDGRLALWENGVPVSMAGLPARTRHGVRIGYVYTPVEHRRKGYASALVATLSQQALDSGFGHCTLYTDLANPTANRIYHAIGYRPVQDVMDVLFERRLIRHSGANSLPA